MGNGDNILVGIDPFIGGEYAYILSLDFLDYMAYFGFVTLNKFKRPNWLKHSPSYWFTAIDLGLHGLWVVDWSTYINDLNRSRIRLNDTSDNLVWSWDKTTGEVSTKESYKEIIM